MDRHTTILGALKQAGHRMTAARKAILELFTGPCKPMTVQEVHQKLQKKNMKTNLTTVYRELEFLRGQGILRNVQLEDGVVRFELSQDDHHHHLVCEQCHIIEEIHLDHDLDEIEQRIKRTKQFEVQRHSLEFYGLCRRCRR